jgi:hypothetical protein
MGHILHGVGNLIWARAGRGSIRSPSQYAKPREEIVHFPGMPVAKKPVWDFIPDLEELESIMDGIRMKTTVLLAVWYPIWAKTAWGGRPGIAPEDRV